MAEPLSALGQSADPNALAYRSSLLPLGRTNAGALTWAVPQAVLSALGAAQYPGQVYRGEASIYDPTTGRVSDEAVQKSFDLAGTAMTGSLPFSKPAGAIGMFGGRNAKTADLHALGVAESMARAGGDREQIWDATGWFRGADGQWRFEIPDDTATISTPRNAPPGYAQLHHDDLAQAYPDLWSNTQQSIRQAPVASGRYEASDKVLHAQGPTEDAMRSVGLHEYQHPIQALEGFSRGANPRSFTATDWEMAGSPVRPGRSFAQSQEDWAWDQYHRTAGEVEARNVQARRDMTPEQRFNTPPWLTQDVPDEQQIVRFGLSTPLSALGR